MSQNLYAQFTGTPMSSEDIDQLLTSQGYGIISLCNEGKPYSIPVSFGYDGEDVYFPFLVTSPDDTKMDFITDGAITRLLVTEIQGRFDWRSVSIMGPARSIDPEESERESFLDALTDNGWFMRGFERADSLDSIQRWKLEVEDVHGLERKEEPMA
ncbi:MAG: pyridoxamine 5'-phosphate oxidase family protein [Halobacteriales archaeon]|nr:pyridoxamine 5'-phosphate oxidase family protein [Halobacteriales archaeon]